MSNELLFLINWFGFTFIFLDAYEDSSGASATQAEKEEVDSRSIYVGNVRFINPFQFLFKFWIFFICLFG